MNDRRKQKSGSKPSSRLFQSQTEQKANCEDIMPQAHRNTIQGMYEKAPGANPVAVNQGNPGRLAGTT